MAINRSKINKEVSKGSKKKKKNKEVAGLGKWMKENLGPKGLKYHFMSKTPGILKNIQEYIPYEAMPLLKKGGKVIKKQKKSKKTMSGADFVASLYNKEK